MIHLALTIAAFLFLCWVGLTLLGFIIAAFSKNWGCGCLTTIIVLIAAAVFGAIFF